MHTAHMALADKTFTNVGNHGFECVGLRTLVQDEVVTNDSE